MSGVRDRVKVFEGVIAVETEAAERSREATRRLHGQRSEEREHGTSDHSEYVLAFMLCPLRRLTFAGVSPDYLAFLSRWKSPSNFSISRSKVLTIKNSRFLVEAAIAAPRLCAPRPPACRARSSSARRHLAISTTTLGDRGTSIIYHPYNEIIPSLILAVRGELEGISPRFASVSAYAVLSILLLIHSLFRFW